MGSEKVRALVDETKASLNCPLFVRYIIWVVVGGCREVHRIPETNCTMLKPGLVKTDQRRSKQ